MGREPFFLAGNFLGRRGGNLFFFFGEEGGRVERRELLFWVGGTTFFGRDFFVWGGGGRRGPFLFGREGDFFLLEGRRGREPFLGEREPFFLVFFFAGRKVNLFLVWRREGGRREGREPLFWWEGGNLFGVRRNLFF